MTHIQMTTHVDAPIDRVFHLGTDYERFPDWNVSYSEVKEITGPSHQVGTKVFAVMRVLGHFVEGSAEITEVEPNRMVKLVGVGLEGGALTTTHRFTASNGGTDVEVDLDYELPAGFLGQIADRLFVERSVERDIRHSLENFKALAEAQVPALA